MTRQKSFSEALDIAFFQVSVPPRVLPQGYYCRAGQKFPALNIKIQLFHHTLRYKPTDTFVSAGLQFGLERDAKHHRGMPSGAGRLPG